jgi:hypothetical protein
MKISVHGKKPFQAKPGQLLRTHIEYGEGDGAAVSHEHEPAAGAKSEPWTPGPSPLKKHFSSRMEAHQHAAQHAGVNAEMVEGDPTESQDEQQGADDDPGAQPTLSKAAAPARRI